MKKIVMTMGAAALLATAAQAELFVGIDMINQDSMTYTMEDTSGWEADFDGEVSGYKIKLGGGDPKDFSFDIYYSMLETDGDFFAKRDIQELGINARPYASITNELGLYFQAGVGYGSMDIEGTWLGNTSGESTWDYVDAHVGIGVSYLLANQIELNLGYDYKLQVWQDIETLSDTTSTSATGGGVYFGVNFYFGDVGGGVSPARTQPNYQYREPAAPQPAKNEQIIY